MIVDTHTDMAIETIQLALQRELLEDLIEGARTAKPIKLGSVALVYLVGLRTICDEISAQNDLDLKRFGQ